MEDERMSKWRPIETLSREPTDETWHILAYRPSGRRPVGELVRFQPYEGASWHWSTPHGVSGRGYEVFWDAITHWMPLPDPPAD